VQIHAPLKKTSSNKVVIVLAMHGIPPSDFPKDERKELFELRAALRHLARPTSDFLNRHDALDKKMRQWPRTEANDAFYFGSLALGKDFAEHAGFQVIVGFNEFCEPDLDQAISRAVELTDEKVLVTTPMMTRGGGHSKGDIPAAIACVQKRHPDTEIIYAWPFPVSGVAAFLAEQIQSFIT